MPIYFEAKSNADAIVETITPFCQRVGIAGSLRRRKPVVKDIEIVAIPKWEERADPDSLFGTPVPVNLLYEEWALNAGFPQLVDRLRRAREWQRIEWIKPGVAEVIAWHVKSDGAYWRGILPDGTKLDMFLTTPEKWAVILPIRTGSAEFSHELVTHAKRRNTPVEQGRILHHGRPVQLWEEHEVFDYLGLQWVEPQERTGKEALIHKR